MTSRPAARADRPSNRAEALLFTASAASAPVMRRNSDCRCACRDPRRPVPRSISRSEYPRPTASAAARAASLSGARPRLVWMTTPVALMTGRGDGSVRLAISDRTASAISSPDGAALPESTFFRAASSVSRASSTTISRPCAHTAAESDSPFTTRSTLGRLRSSEAFVICSLDRSAAPLEKSLWCRLVFYHLAACKHFQAMALDDNTRLVTTVYGSPKRLRFRSRQSRSGDTADALS